MKGGYRIGAGRKQGFAAKNAEEARKLLSERVAQEIAPLTDILIKRAKAGNMRAMHELLDRAWGRAPQALQIESNDRRYPIPIMGFEIDEITEETLQRYHFTDEEREVLEKRLIPKRIQ